MRLGVAVHMECARVLLYMRFWPFDPYPDMGWLASRIATPILHRGYSLAFEPSGFCELNKSVA